MLEASQTQEPGTAAYAGDFGFKVLTSSDPAEKTKKLSLGRVFRSGFSGDLFFNVRVLWRDVKKQRGRGWA